MKVSHKRFSYALAMLTLLAATWAPTAARADEEADLIQVLGSEESAPVKSRACERLKTIGTVHSVDALGSLLADEAVAHAARFALEVMPFPEAGAALCAALDATSGRTKVGIINSIGERREEASVTALTGQLADADAQVAAAAMAAMGKIGSKQATAVLREMEPTVAAELQLALSAALLACAEEQLENGSRRLARKVYQDLHDGDSAEHIRVAAFRGLAFTAGKKAMKVVRQGLTGGDAVSESAALGLIVELEGKAVAKEISKLLPDVSPRLQAALLRAAEQRGEQALASAVVEMLSSEDPGVKIAALGAMATTGDASSVPVLASMASETDGAERQAARDALDRLQGAGVNENLLSGLDNSDPAVRVELLRSLSERRVVTAAPAMLTVAGTDADETVRLAALASVTALSDDEAVAPLVSLVIGAKSDDERKAAEKALALTCGRSADKERCADEVLAGITRLAEANVPASCALLRVCGPIGGADTLEMLRGGVTYRFEEVRDASIRALSESPDLAAAPDLLALARDAATPTHRVLALRGYIRLTADTADIPADARLKMFEAALAAAQRDDEKRQVLSGVAKMHTLDALHLAQKYLGDDALRAEAETACFQVGSALIGSHKQEALAVLRTIAEQSENQALREGAQGILTVVKRSEENITEWVASAPYLQEGVGYLDLFDVVFPPEVPGSKDVVWQPVVGSTDPNQLWFVDLLAIFGGTQRVGYIRTTIVSDREQEGWLEMGSDDGIKVWLNGSLVHSNNATRGLVPENDRVEVTLKQGDNTLLVKVTQFVAGWSFCGRLRNPDGSRMEGLKVRAE